jgi:DNA-binding transcriptional LysR family regulator
MVLLTRTTRSVAPTEAGQRLIDGAGPGLAQAIQALSNVSAKPGEVGGRVRISVSRMMVPLVLAPMLPTFRARHPQVEVDIVIEERLVDIVADGYDAGVRLSESIDKDMVRVRLTGEFRLVIVATPEYLASRGVPRKPEDLLQHECITFRSPTNGALYAWELERGRKNWRVPVRGGVVTNDGHSALMLAEQGLGLAYTLEPIVAQQVRAGQLKIVLESYAPTVPGFFLYFPSRAQTSPALRLFVDVAKEVFGRNK